MTSLSGMSSIKETFMKATKISTTRNGLNGGRKAGDLPKKYENFSLKTLRWITDIAVSLFRFYTAKI